MNADRRKWHSWPQLAALRCAEMLHVLFLQTEMVTEADQHNCMSVFPVSQYSAHLLFIKLCKKPVTLVASVINSLHAGSGGPPHPHPNLSALKKGLDFGAAAALLT